MYDVTIDFPKFKVALATHEGRVVEIRYLPLSAPAVAARNALAAEAARQIAAYRENPDTAFDLPLVIEGSELEKGVWRAMCAIPRGRTRTYGEIARELKSEARVVGQACGDNRLPIVIPCHRVVAAGGIGGFAHSTGGYLLEVKRWLLAHECGADAFELTP
ncbi:MAG: methylated-DNA--[protein]-cysteine S-methyltransferase [Betaproteobacteria bacterium]